MVWIIVVFKSAVWTSILTAPIHSRGSIGEQIMYCKIFPWRNNLIYIPGWPEGEYFLNKYLVNYSFNSPSMIHINLQRNGKASVNIVRRVYLSSCTAHIFPHIVFVPKAKFFSSWETVWKSIYTHKLVIQIWWITGIVHPKMTFLSPGTHVVSKPVRLTFLLEPKMRWDETLKNIHTTRI